MDGVCQLSTSQPLSDENDGAESTAAAERAVDATFSTLFSQRLRTPADRTECANLFARAFGRRPALRPPPAVALRGGSLQVGGAVFTCSSGGGDGGGGGSSVACAADEESLGLLRGQLGALEAAAHCAAQGWMTIVVGPPASGKTSLVQTLATLAGRTLRQVILSSLP